MPFPAFHDVRFPLELALGARGGPERRTEIVTLASGREERNARWAHARRRYEAGQGVRTLAKLSEVVAFFEERRGRLIGFRYRDPLDFSSSADAAPPAATDQRLGTGDGGRTMFQLVKTYGTAPTPIAVRSPSRWPAASGSRSPASNSRAGRSQSIPRPGS